MATDVQRNTAYGLNQALLGVAHEPIIARRNPTANDRAPLGTPWVNRNNGAYWMATQVIGNATTWSTGANAAANFATVGFVTVGNTLTVTAGGATITAGGLTVTAGGATITAGGITVNGGSIDVVAGSIHAAVNCTVDGDIEVTGGDLTVDAGNLEVTLGNATVTTGDIFVTAGGVYAPAGGAVRGFELASVGGLTIDDAGTATTLTCGAGVPAAVEPVGSLYINTVGVGHNDRLYISVGAGVWESFTSAQFKKSDWGDFPLGLFIDSMQ